MAIPTVQNDASGKLLTDLAKTVLANASALETYFDANGLGQPSFEEHAPPELVLTPEMKQVRQKTIDASVELTDLLLGPAMLLRPIINASGLQAVYKYNIPSKVPLDGEISYRDLAAAVDLQEVDVARIVRFVSTHYRIFQEKKIGYVCHSAASRLLVESPDAMAALGFMYDECFQAFAHTVEALQANKNPQPNQTGWSVANRKDISMWDYHITHPERSERASRAMAMVSKGINHDISGLTRGYDWSKLNASKGLLVDVGGANGHAAISIARENPDMRFVVQDISSVISKGKDEVPQDVANRVNFITYDVRDPQPIVAQAYLYRQIFHNWNDEDCVKIMKALVPAMRSGAKIIVNDSIMPDPGTLPPMQERAIRAMDLGMMSLFNSRERTTADWVMLFERADPRYQNIKAWKPEGSHLGLVEATWVE